MWRCVWEWGGQGIKGRVKEGGGKKREVAVGQLRGLHRALREIGRVSPCPGVSLDEGISPGQHPPSLPWPSVWQPPDNLIPSLPMTAKS